MFAGQQDGDERLEILVGQRHVGCPECRHDLESRDFEVGAPIDDHEREPLEARFAQCQDLGVVGRNKRRDTEPIPGVESATEALCIRAQGTSTSDEPGSASRVRSSRDRTVQCLLLPRPDAPTRSASTPNRRLAGHRDRRAACNPVAVAGGAFIFSHDPDGGMPWKPNWITKEFVRLRRDAGIPHCRLHDLRHFMATEMLAAGVFRSLCPVAGRARSSLRPARQMAALTQALLGGTSSLGLFLQAVTSKNH